MSWEEFRVGQRVLFKCDENHVWWCEGKITRVNAASNTSNTYSIKQWVAACDTIPGSSDPPMMQPGQTFLEVPQRRMKLFPNEKSYVDKLMEATYQSPPYKDPHTHLYMKQKTKTVIANGKRMQQACIKIPLEELSGVVGDSDAIWRIIRQVKNRRKVSGGASAANVDPVMLVNSVIPKNRNFDKDVLYEKAQHDSALMLQLADLSHFGLCRVSTDFNKALTYYRCAAWGLSEEEGEKLGKQAVHYSFTYPMGQPEALCALAGILWYMLGESINEHNPDAMIQAIRQAPDLHGVAQMVVFLLGHAIRREWECPLAFVVGQALRDAQMMDAFLPGSFNLLQALECKITREEESPPQFMEDLRQKQMSHDEYLAMQNDQAELSEEDFLMFSKKATSIFLDLPVKILAPSGMVHSNIHVEYARMSFPPYPLVVFIINPLAEYIYGTVKLLGELEYMPYSPDAFKFIWDKIVFSLHRGVNGTKRFRPPLITFADRSGDRHLAEFIKSQIGSNSGTEIKVVRTNEYKLKQGREYRAMYDIMESMKEDMNRGMKQMMRNNDAEVRLPTQTNECIDIPIEELLLDVEGIKAEGNAFFIQERFHPAQRCYSEAIDKIQRSMNVDQRVKKLLGTILSNRAACFLKTSENMSPDTAKAALMKAVDDCTVAMKFSTILPSRVVMKIERRKNDALKRIGGIKSQESAWGELSSFNAVTEEQLGVPNQAVHSSGSRPRRGNNRSRRNRRRRGGRRRNQNRNQRSSTSEVVENSDKEASVESVVTTTTVILGKDLLENELSEFITESEDPCPCCFERFRVELSDIHTTVLQCNHVCCLPCLTDLQKKSRRNRDPIPFTCPICRFPIQENILENAINPVLESTTSIQERLKILPLGELDSENVARTLLSTKMFKIGDVLRALDAMLTDSLQATLRKDKLLSPEEKQAIYEECRRPIDILLSEIDQKRSEYNLLRDWESEEAKTKAARIEEIQKVLIPKAREKAMNAIWEKVNIGKMGHENEFGEVEVDFHALHVDEAKKQFDQRVLPVLEALGSVLLIVGRGNHSEGHISKLKPALRRHIQTHRKKKSMCHGQVEGNDGAMRVKWIG